MKHLMILVAWLVGAFGARAGEVTMERRVLMGAESAKQWNTAESSVESSEKHVRGGGKAALHWHITVDHYGGEAKYPIGWPRINY
jgi:hypothetical protein